MSLFQRWEGGQYGDKCGQEGADEIILGHTSQ